MLVIDENKMKLLRMKEKLLEVSFDNRYQILSQYKEIVLDIDRNMYDRLIDMIKNTNYHNQPLEEQLIFLTGVENEYNDFNEFQCRYKNIYEKYADDKLVLSPIEDIYIDKIREKIDAINGYLVNKQNLDRYRQKIEELNIKLINAEKKKSEIEARFCLLEKELITNVFNAEGRIDNQGSLEYASIPKEFEKYGFDLKKLLSDNDLLMQELNNAHSGLVSKESTLEATKVCFDNMPNDIETKRLYNISYFDTLAASYKLVLLKVANLLANECNNYEEIRNKRLELKNLIKERTKILNDLRIKFVDNADPFHKIKLDEQLEIIELLGKNLQDAFQIKEKIKEMFNLVDDINIKSSELYSVISDESELFKNRDIVVTAIGEVDPLVEERQIDENKVINIRDVSSKMNLELMHRKTDGVIARVYELFTAVSVATKSVDVVPELVIQGNSIFTDEVDSQNIFEDSKSQDNGIFVDGLATQEIFSDNKNESSINSDLFSDVEPFKETVLFTNKYDDVFAKKKMDKEEMPELFFDTEQGSFYETEEENNKEENDDLSLDEQIKALKLVA